MGSSVPWDVPSAELTHRWSLSSRGSGLTGESPWAFVYDVSYGTVAAKLVEESSGARGENTSVPSGFDPRSGPISSPNKGPSKPSSACEFESHNGTELGSRSRGSSR